MSKSFSTLRWSLGGCLSYVPMTGLYRTGIPLCHVTNVASSEHSNRFTAHPAGQYLAPHLQTLVSCPIWSTQHIENVCFLSSKLLQCMTFLSLTQHSKAQCRNPSRQKHTSAKLLHRTAQHLSAPSTAQPGTHCLLQTAAQSWEPACRRGEWELQGSFLGLLTSFSHSLDLH